MSDAEYDVAIVGGGFTGILLAKELSARGLDVLILEAGYATGKTFEQHVSNVQHMAAEANKVPNSAYEDNPMAPSPSVLDIRKPDPDDPYTGGYLVQRGPNPFSSNYQRNLGGTSKHWLGLTFRMLPNDMSMYDTYGVGVNWPLEPDDLSPYYERAEFELGVAGEVEEQTFHGLKFRDGYVYPMHKIPQSYLDEWMAKGLHGHDFEYEDHGVRLREPLDVVSLPTARNSTPNVAYTCPDGRPYVPVGGTDTTGTRCEGNSSCVPICPVQAKWDATRSLRTVDPSKVHLQTQAVVTKIEHGDKEVTGPTYRRYTEMGPSGAPVTVTAKRYVLAGHAMANPMLMQASGLHDRSDQTGRNLMDHPYVLMWGLAPENIGAFRGPGVTSGVPSLRDGPWRSKTAAWRTDISNWGWNMSTFAPGSDVDAAVGSGLRGRALRDHLADTIPRQMYLGFLTEQLPDRNNTVTIDKRYVDALGQPRPVIDYRIDPYTSGAWPMAEAFTERVFEILGIEDHTSYSDTDPGWVTVGTGGYTYHGAGHIAGTHRMGDDAHHSTVDSWSRHWGYPNLFVVGCGSMPTLGTGNPSLTMAALLYRTADAIVDDLGGRA